MILFFIFSAIVHSEFQKDRSYSVSVKSKYSDVQTLDNFLYFLSDFSLETSNRFLSEVLKHSNDPQAINDIEFLSSTISNLKLISPSSLSILKSYIDINYYLPRCEMLRSLAHNIANEPITLINNDPGFFLASKNPIDNPDNFQYFQTNFTQLFNFDFNLNEYNNKRDTLFIYADLTKEKASNFVLQIINGQLTKFNTYNIILRPLSYTNKTANLRGFGVEMRPYKYLMEYEVDDDTIKTDDKKSDTANSKEDNTTKSIDFEPISDYLNYTEIPFFGSKFVNYLITENSQKELPLLLRDMSNNLPIYIRRISEEDVSVESTKQYEKMSLFAERSQSQQNQNKEDDSGSIYTVSTLNGRVFNIKNFDAFTFMDQIQEEQRFSDFLIDEFNLTKSDISFSEPFNLNDDYLLDYRTKYAVWNKDFERNVEYQDWSTNIQNIFKLKKNILNFVIYLDPTNPMHLTELYTVYLISQPQKNKNGQQNALLPMRIGIVPRFNMGSKASRRVAFAFAHIALHNQKDAIKFLVHSFALWKKSEESSKKKNTGIKEEHYILAYEHIKGSYKVEWGDLHKLFSPDSREYMYILESNKYFKSCGAAPGSLRVNGKEVLLDKSLQELIAHIQQMVLSISKICKSLNIYDLAKIDIVELLKKEYLVVQSVDDTVLKQQVSGLEIFNSNTKKQKSFVDAFRSVEWSIKDNQNPRSYFVLFAPKQEASIQAVNETSKTAEDIENENEEEIVDDENENDVDDDDEKDEDEVEVKAKSVANDPESLFTEFAKNRSHRRSTAFAVNPPQLREFIGVEENETALLVNGRIYRSFNLKTIDQLKLIDYWSDQYVLSYVDTLEASASMNKQSKSIEKVEGENDFDDEGEKIDHDEDNFSNNDDDDNENIKKKPLSFDALSYITAVSVDWRKHSVQRINVQNIFDGVKGIEDCPLYYNSRKETDSKSGKIEWILIVDPISRNFQKIADFIYYTTTVRSIVDLQLVIVPPQTINANNNEQQENDLNSFYRFSLTSDDVTFSMLNDTLSYSTFVDTPQSWLLESLRTSDNLDVDSVQLPKSNTSKEAVFLLSSMVVEGKLNIEGAPVPKFADVGLFTKKSEINHFRSQKVDETTVLPMNSYFQFKADPGVYRAVFSSNASSNLYTFDSAVNKNQEFPVFDNIYVDTFSKKDFILNGKIRAKNHEAFKRSLQERSNRLRQESISSNKTISHVNIFTIASGKLYERLCKIMFLSVREHTESTITFYLIKSFLSPSFKASLPEMAKKYSFNYNFVDYKWPSWLNKQKEKQRNIWANKILFLDVLFPSNVDKIIYVDADQIVRTDLQELMDLDITTEGAPYAFVPFCDSRPEIEPYRFWKQGYWKEVLTKDKDKKSKGLNQLPATYNYHISALFAIDLLKFKEILAGDQLRIAYQQLSVDSKNLANLDQDLPNSLQKHIPIYSLSQDWLWCETWCADEEMESAKTIDLCNNPLTKINKIEIARERIQEWPKLDEEAKKTEDDVSSTDYEQFVFRN